MEFGIAMMTLLTLYAHLYKGAKILFGYRHYKELNCRCCVNHQLISIWSCKIYPIFSLSKGLLMFAQNNIEG